LLLVYWVWVTVWAAQKAHRLGIGASPWAIAALFFNLIAVIALTSMPVSAGPAQSAAI
jgi:hypothetical protein